MATFQERQKKQIDEMLKQQGPVKKRTAIDNILKPVNQGYEDWKVDRAERVKQSNVDAALGLPSRARMTPSYDGYKAPAKSNRPVWETAHLKDLSIKKYGRSYDAKFQNWAREQGVPDQMHYQFRQWLNARDQGVKSDAWKATDGQIEQNIEVSKAKEASEKRAAERKKELEAKAAEPKKKSGLDKFTDLFTSDRPTVKDQLRQTGGTGGLVEAAKKGILPDSYERFDTRIADSQSFGLIQNKMLRDLKDNPTPEKQAEYERLFGDSKGGQKAADITAELLGYAGPGVLASLGIRTGAKALGKEMGKGSLKKSAKEIAAEGAAIGGVIGGGEVAVRESLNPEDTTAMQNLAHLGINVAAGAVLDPILSLAGPAAKQLLKSSANDVGSKAAMRQIDELIKSGEYSPLDPLKKPDGKSSYSSTSQLEDILTGKTPSPRSVQNTLGEAAGLNPRIGQAQALRELTQAPARATIKTPEIPRAKFNPDDSIDRKMEFFRDKSNPITEAEIPHAYKMMEDLERSIADVRENPQIKAVIANSSPEYVQISKNLEDLTRKKTEIANKMQLWQETKAMQELYKPANRPEYYKFKIPDNVKEDFSDVPKRFRSAQENSMHIDEAATAAGYDSIDEFVDHLVKMDNALGTKRSDIKLPSAKSMKDLDKGEAVMTKQQEDIIDSFTGIRDMEANLEELAGYIQPREGILSDVQSSPFENARTITMQRNSPVQQEQVRSDKYGDGEHALTDDLIEQLLSKNSNSKAEPVAEPVAATTEFPQSTPMGATARAMDRYEGTGMAEMPKTVDRVAEKVKSFPDEVNKFQENWNSSIYSAKKLEEVVTARLQQSEVDVVIDLLPEGSNKRTIAYADNFAKQVQGLPKAVAKAIRSYQKGYEPVFKTLKKNKIPRENFEEYALSKHAIDIFENNGEKAARRGELHAELEFIESQRINKPDPKQRKELDKQESEILSEMDTLEMYKLPKGMTEEKARHLVSTYEKYTGMEEAHNLFLAEQKKDLYDLYYSGQHTKAEIEAMMEAHPNYVSLQRDVPDSTNIFNYTKPNKAKTPIRARGEGSHEYDILPVLDGAFNNRLATQTSVARNDAINTLEKWSKIEGLEGLVKEISPNDPRFPNVAKNTLKGYRDGKEIYYEVPPAIREMMDRQSSGIKDDVSMKALKMLSMAFKRGTTNWNPQFHIKSALRDTTQALANSRTDAKMWDMSMGFLDSFIGPQLSKITNGRFKSYREVYKDMGGDMAGFISQDMYSVHRMTEALRKGSLDGKTVLNPFKHVENFGMTMEHGARLGEFRSAKKKGYSDSDASFEATDLIDYSDQGRMTKAINPYDPYLSATIRGNIRTFQAMKKNPKQFIKAGTVFVTAPTLALYGMRYAPTTSDEQRAKIENMPTYQKNTFWAIPVPNTDHIMLMPKPFILGQMFANPIERMLDHSFADKNKPISQDIVDTLFDVQNVGMPPMSLAGFTLGIELMANKDFFSGFDIESQGMKNKPAADRHDAYTSEVAKKIGSVTGHELVPEELQVSPKKVDHVIKKVGGTLGRQGLDVLDNILAEGGERPAKSETSGQILNPVGSLIYKDTAASGLYNRIKKAADKDADKWRADNPDKLRTPTKDRSKTNAQKAYDQMKELNDEVKEIRESTKYSAKQKNELISELRTKQKLIGSEFLQSD